MGTSPKSPWAVCSLFALLYALFPTRCYSHGALQTALMAEAGMADHPRFWQLPHLLWNATALALWQAAPWEGFRTLHRLQLLDALAAAATLGLVVALGLRLGDDVRVVILAGAALGVSFGFWIHAIDGKLYPVALLLATFSATCMVRMEEGSRWWIAGAVLGTALAISFGAFNAALLAPLAWALYRRGGWPLAAAGTVAAGALLVAELWWIAGRLESPGSVAERVWLEAASGDPRVAGGLFPRLALLASLLPGAVLGKGRFPTPFEGPHPSAQWAAAAAPWLTGILALLGLAGLAAGGGALWSRRGPAGVFLLWLGGLAALLVTFDPANNYQYALLTPFLLLWLTAGGGEGRGARRARALLWAAALLALAAAGPANFALKVFPCTGERSRDLRLLRQLEGVVTPRDLLVQGGDSRQVLLAAYFLRCRVLSATWCLDLAERSGAAPEEVLGDWIRTLGARSRRVFLSPSVLAPESYRHPRLRGVPVEEVERYLEERFGFEEAPGPLRLLREPRNEPPPAAGWKAPEWPFPR